MIEINYNNSLENSTNQKITKVKSIIITTDAGDILFAPIENAGVTVTTEDVFGLVGSLTKKEATIEFEYDNMIVIK